MRRAVVLVLLGLTLCAGSALAGKPTDGLMVYGGYAYPVLQDDTGGGAIFGARLPLGMLKVITIEPFYASSNLGDAEETLGGISYTRSGFDITAFGASAIVGGVGGEGVKFYPVVGIGSWKLSREGSEDVTNLGWNFGLGVGIPVATKFSLQIRGELDMIVDGDTSRKFGTGTVGLNYDIIH